MSFQAFENILENMPGYSPKSPEILLTKRMGTIVSVYS